MARYDQRDEAVQKFSPHRQRISPAEHYFVAAACASSHHVLLPYDSWLLFSGLRSASDAYEPNRWCNSTGFFPAGI